MCVGNKEKLKAKTQQDSNLNSKKIFTFLTNALFFDPFRKRDQAAVDLPHLFFHDASRRTHDKKYFGGYIFCNELAASKRRWIFRTNTGEE